MAAASAWAQTSAGFGIASGIVTQAGAEGMPDATAVLSNPTPGTAVMTTLASGQPVTPVVVVEGQQFSAITMDYTSSLNGSGGQSRVRFDAVNSLKTGSAFNVDARLARTFAFTQRIKGTVGFEAFNLLNRQQATAVNAIAYDSVRRFRLA